MTAITDVQTIAPILAGKAVTNAALLRVATRYADADPFSLIANGVTVVVDKDNLTNEEKAQHILDGIWFNIRSVGENIVRRQSQESRDGDVQADVDSAMADY